LAKHLTLILGFLQLRQSKGKKLTTYAEFSTNPRSEKGILAWVEPTQKLITFTLFSGAVYSRITSYFVIGVSASGTDLTEGSSSTLNASEWFFDAVNLTLYVRMSDDLDPKTHDLSVKYRLFYSNLDYNLPYDLASGEVVNYDALIMGSSKFSQELDEEQTGISLESTGSIKFQNTGGHFDNIFDTLFWENKRVVIYSWGPSIAISEKRKLFEGVIDKKGFTENQVTFGLRDNIFQLRKKLNLSLFSSSDGSLSDDILGTPKRAVYGQVKQMQAIGIDKVLDGYTLTGTVSGVSGALIIKGTGTAFLDECSPGDNLKITLPAEVLEIKIDSVDTDTQITISDALNSGFDTLAALNEPARPWRKKNRNWHISGHKLRAPATTIATAVQENRYTIVDTTDFFTGDSIQIDGESTEVRRLSGDLIVLENNLQAGIASIGDAVTKNPVTKVLFGATELLVDRDWTLSNTSTDAIINFTNTAEFNAQKRVSIVGTITFTNNSRAITGTNSAFKTDFQTRDWIQSDDTSHTAFYEVLSIESDTAMTLRVVYGGATHGVGAFKKNVKILDDTALVLIDTVGRERSGAWVKTASDVVKDVLENDAGLTSLNSASFTTADTQAPFIMSMVFPESIGGKAPEIKKVINLVNESVFGSLTFNQDFDLVFTILNSEKPISLVEIKDDDTLSFGILSNMNIFNKVKTNYSHFVDKFSGDDTSETIEKTSSFVNNHIGTEKTEDLEIYLFNESDASVISERYLLFHSLSQSVVKVAGKLDLSTYNLNDKIYIDFDRAPLRFAQTDRRKIGILSRIKRDGENSEAEFQDISNILSRVPAIAPNTTAAFSSATADDLVKYGWICDNTTATPDGTESQLGSNLIG